MAKEFEAKHHRKWRPVVRMDRALYGHPDAGALWERYCHKVLMELGFKPIQNWGTCYVHPRKDLYLTVYVDDMQMAGPEHEVKAMWDKIRAVLECDEPTWTCILVACRNAKSSKLTQMSC